MPFSTDSSKPRRRMIRTRAALEAYLARERVKQERNFKKIKNGIFRKNGELTNDAIEWIKYEGEVENWISLEHVNLQAIAAENNGEGLIGLDLSGCDLSNKNLSKLNLTGINLRACNLMDVDFKGANCTGADLRDSWLDGANCTEAIFYNAYLNRTTCSLDTIFINTDFRLADLREADFSHARDSDGDIASAPILHGADLRGARLQGAKFNGTDLRFVRVYDTDLKGVNIKVAKHLPHPEKRIVTHSTLACIPPPFLLIGSPSHLVSILSTKDR